MLHKDTSNKPLATYLNTLDTVYGIKPFDEHVNVERETEISEH